MIDIGGESTRPYSEGISEDEELERVMPVIRGLIREVDIPISIDTQKATVAWHAINEGASIINDISALRSDPAMCSVAAEAGVPLILMHMKGTPSNMQQNPVYADLIGEILDFLTEAKERAIQGGVRREMIIVDPGIGFGKSFDHNLQIIKELMTIVCNKELQLRKAGNIKYLSFINPLVNKKVWFEISYKCHEEGRISCSARVYFETTTFCSFKGEFGAI